MPRKGVPICEHSEGRSTRDYWLIEARGHRLLIECKHCRKRRWTSARYGVYSLETKACAKDQALIAFSAPLITESEAE